MRRAAATGAVLAVVAPVAGGSAAGPPLDGTDLILGVDLSYVNEVEDCGGTYRDGTLGDPFTILAQRGANLVRARLWNDPDWTDYSTIDDVIRTFDRARATGMRTLLDFHYSDEWADPARQNAPAAWSQISDIDELAAALYDYTVATLERLDAAGLLPDMVQVGNEINSGLVNSAVGLDWHHELPLLNAGIAAVRAVSESTAHPIDVMIHVAQPENGLWWFEQAVDAGLTDFDVIGLSYYPQWSSFSPEDLGAAVHALATTYGKDVIVVETGYPWTLDSAGDTADNVLDQALRSYDISPTGQAAFMGDLTQIVVANGGSGTVYWEPAWLSTRCRTRWGQGSHWENATLFDFEGSVHAGAGYLGRDYDALPDPTGDRTIAVDRAGDTDQPDADLISVATVHDGGVAMVAATISGDVRQWAGSLLLAIDNAGSAGGDGGRRPYDFADARPELLLESSWNDEPGIGYVSTTLATWRRDSWEPGTFTGRVVVASSPGGMTIMTWVLPAAMVEPTAGVSVMTARRGRTGALADVIDPGTTETPVLIAIDH